MTVGAPFRAEFDDASPADQFHLWVRSMATYLWIGALITILIGLTLASLNVWDQRERLAGFGDGLSVRFYILNFFSVFATYGLISAILFAGGALVSSMAWFQSALSADMADIYEAVEGEDEPAVGLHSPDPQGWERPLESDSDAD